MECRKTLKLLDAYLENSLSWQDAELVDQHLKFCSDCAYELHQLRSLSQIMQSLKRREPPVDLSLKTKIKASRQNDVFAWNRVVSKWDNFFRPLAIPAFSGVVLTSLFFVVLLSTFFSGTNLSASDHNDIPLTFFTPPRTQSLRMSQLVQLDNFKSIKKPLTVEASIDHNGVVVDYNVLQGPTDPTTIRRLNQFFFFEVYFDPATLFGRPTSGKIVLAFNMIDVVG